MVRPGLSISGVPPLCSGVLCDPIGSGGRSRLRELLLSLAAVGVCTGETLRPGDAGRDEGRDEGREDGRLDGRDEVAAARLWQSQARVRRTWVDVSHARNRRDRLLLFKTTSGGVLDECEKPNGISSVIELRVLNFSEGFTENVIALVRFSAAERAHHLLAIVR